MRHDAVLPVYVTFAEVHAALPLQGDIDIATLGSKLHARPGNVYGACEKLLEAGCAGRVHRDSDGFCYYRTNCGVVPEGRFAAWFTGGGDTKSAAPAAAVDVEGGGVTARRSSEPMKVYGEDPNRPRVPLSQIQQQARLTEAMAKRYVARDIADLHATGVETPAALAIAADAHAAAAEMLRARAKRLQLAPPVRAAAE
jgi:hypothetical protein